MTETLSLRVKIEQSPMGAYQWMIVVMAAIMNLLDGFDVLALAFTATAIRGEFGLTGIELGYLLSAGLFGMTAGSLFLAPLADKIGRRPLLLMAVSLSAIGMLGSVFIYVGKQINREKLLRYIVSFRQHNEFHEQCVERIFCDLMHYAKPEKLTVYARYTRRGGLDINPFRSNFEEIPQNLRLARQ